MKRPDFTATQVCIFTWLALFSAGAAAQTAVPQFTLGDTCRRFNDGVVALLDQGKVREALAILRSKLAAGSGKEEPACLSVTMHNWAATLVAAGNTMDAEAPAAQSVALLDQLTAPDDPVRLRPLQTLWFVYGALGEVARARQAYQALGALRLVTLHDKAVVLSISAAQLRLEGQKSQAENRYLAAISAWKALGMDGSIEMASLLCDLGLLYGEENRPIDAETMLTRAVSIIGSAPGATLSEMIGIRNQQIVLHARQGHWDSARGELKALVELGESSQLGGSLLTILYSNYAYVLQKTHQKKAARVIAARAAAIPSVLPSSALIDISALTNRKRP